MLKLAMTLLAALVICTPAMADALPAGVTCAIVRAKVAEHGKAAAFAWALRNGFSLSQIGEARKCLARAAREARRRSVARQASRDASIKRQHAAYPARPIWPDLETPMRPRFIAGRLVCARNVGVALAARGIHGTGSAVAKSYLNWGRSSPAVPGAVAVFHRRGGGHVAIVDHVEPDGAVYYLNPGRRGWAVVQIRRPAITFRIS